MGGKPSQFEGCRFHQNLGVGQKFALLAGDGGPTFDPGWEEQVVLGQKAVVDVVNKGPGFQQVWSLTQCYSVGF